ncbi:MAG TPA: hypothetical protein VJB61_15765 [Actinomycetota bacterium]
MAPIAAALLPHPPLLVPDLAGTAAPELDPLRAACREALVTVTAAADLTILVGTGPVWAVPTPSALGSFHPYGADLDVTLPALTDLDLPAAPPPAQLAELPLSLAIAAHLLATLDPPPTRLAAVTVPAALGPSAAATIGHALAAAGQRVAAADSGPPSGSRGDQAHGSADRARAAARIGLVVMGDLSACRTDRAPGGFRPEAAAFDASISEAFHSAAPRRLLDLDPTQAATLLVSARVPLQVLAGAFEQIDPTGEARGRQGQPGRGGPIAKVPGEHGSDAVARQTGSGGTLDQTRPALRGRVLYERAPYGVGYLVAILTAS